MMGGLGGPRHILESEVRKPQALGATLRRFGRYFRQFWQGVTVALLLLVGGTWVQIRAPQLIGQSFDCYLFPNPQGCTYTTIDQAATIEQRISGLGGLVLLLAVLMIAGALMNGLAFYSMGWTGHNVLREMRKQLFHKIQRLSLGYYSRNEAGNIMSRVTSDTDTIGQTFGFALMNVLSGSLLIGWIMFEMLTDNLMYGLLSLSMVPVMIVATMYFSGQARKAYRISREQMGSVNADLQESIAGAREVQAFNREDESIRQFERTNAANRDANIRAATFTSALTPVLEALGFVAIAIVVVVGGLAVLRGTSMFGGGAITLGLVVTYLQYVQRFNQPIQQIAVLWTNIQSAIAGGERIFGLLDEPVDIDERPGAVAMGQIKGQVELRDVSAGYKEGHPVLHGVSFTAHPGQTVAIVGPTGAGKTTIINLIPRFYDVLDGAVLIDGVDVRSVTLDSLRSQIGIVLQDAFLFADTVMENIRYGRLDATDDEVLAAAKLASVDTFAERLSDGYQTVLGERGGGLSQGQRQLISIARAALANPRILILDEATSSVDTRTERLIQHALGELLKGRTSFVIAHRLSTIRNADVVLMIKDGQVIERGTHTELLAKQGAYYDLYMSQFRYEEQAEATTNQQ